MNVDLCFRAPGILHATSIPNRGFGQPFHIGGSWDTPSLQQAGEALHLIHLPATSSVAENAPPATLVHEFSVNLSVSLSPVIPGFPMVVNPSPFTEAFRVNRLSGTDFEISQTQIFTLMCHALVALLSHLSFEFFPKLSLPPTESPPEDIFRIQDLDLLAFSILLFSSLSQQVVTTGKEQLDFETGPKIFDLQIYVKDDVGVTDLQVLTVQVTDVNEPPQFQGNLAQGLNLYVVERTNPGFIYQVEAFDPEDTSQNIPLSHFLISPSKNFRMSANGTLFSTTELDFEAGHKSFYLLVGVRDSGNLEASTVLQVTIVNMNDEVPRFISPRRDYSIPEELPPGTIVANITAEDPDDEGFPGRLLYSITTISSYFVIDQLTGTIQVAQRLDRDAGELRQNPIISLEVLVRDRPSGGQENRIQITFTVEDINDNPATCRRLTFRKLSIALPAIPVLLTSGEEES
ncbi:hypothetical protein STEG23_017082 [Scotinomys teguina]